MKKPTKGTILLAYLAALFALYATSWDLEVKETLTLVLFVITFIAEGYL